MEIKASFNHQHTGERSVARKEKGKFELIVGGMLLLALFPVLLAGCSSSDGANNTNTTGGASAIASATPAGAEMTVSNIALVNVGGKAQVTFDVATDAGPVTDLSFDSIRMYLADLVPAGTATAYLPKGTWDSDYFERWGYESTSSSTPEGAFVNNGDGSYVYTFATAFGSAAALAEAPEYDPTHQQRLLIRISGTAGVTANTVGIMDITAVPAAGQTATEVAAADQRVYASIDGCKKCHGAHMEKAAHANGYLDTRACVVCHSPLGHYGDEMQADNAYFSVLIHKIHSALDLPAFNTRILGNGYVDVTYPQEIKKCDVCHNGVSTQIDNWKSHPTMEICDSCHTTTVYDGTTSFVGLDGVTKTHDAQTDNTGCITCHPASGAGAGGNNEAVHDTTPTGVNVPEYDVTLDLTAPANGTDYETGETPVVTVTLADHATATPFANYTANQDTTGDIDGNLAVASLYIYGPRNEAIPVLATDTVSDPAATFDNITTFATQAHSLFLADSGGVANPDAQVITDATGFKYQMIDDFANLEPGTYMVRVRIGDYGRVGTGNYQIESLAFTTFQVGTTTVEPKVSGDGCLNCHGTGTAPFHDERHAVVFDVDQCLSCHDKSANHADYIGNRVHSVHGATATGDLNDRDWTHVTFPQSANNCTICHTNPAAPTPVWRQPDMLVCGGCHGALPNADPAAYTTDISAELAAAQHMVQNGGDTSSITPVTSSCLVCHGDGKIADPFVTHLLVSFPPPVGP